MNPLAAGLASGILAALALPPFDLWPLAFVGLAPLTIALSRPSLGSNDVALGGIGFGAAYYGLLLHWIPFTLRGLMPLGAALGTLGLALLAGIGGLQAVLLRRLLLVGAAPMLALPAVWVTTEAAFAVAGPFAFPWTPLGLALAGVPEWAGAAEWVGVGGLTFWIAVVNGAVVGVILAPSAGRRRKLAGLTILALGLPAAAGFVRARTLQTTVLPRVLVGQLDVSRDTLMATELRDSSVGAALDRLVERTLESRGDAASPPVVSLVVLPEAPFTGDWADEVRPRVRLYAEALGVEVLIGARIVGADPASASDGSGNGGSDGRLRNAVIAIAPGRPAELAHAKRRLVPGVERPGLVAGPAGGARSTEAGRIGVLVCFEIAFARDARRLRRDGVDLLLNPTNDGWFAPRIFGRPSAAHAQHRAHLMLRAIEGRMGAVRSSLGGEMLAVDPLGRLIASSPVGAEGFFTVSPLTSAEVTVHSRFGDLGAGAGAGLLLLLLFVRRAPLNPSGTPRILQRSAPESSVVPSS
jgi:apolipoprotein N-acyltransferase